MADDNNAIERVGPVDQADEAGIDLRKSESDEISEDIRIQSFGQVAEEAIRTATTRPTGSSHADELRMQITGDGIGPVGEMRQAMVSSVERPGAPKIDPVDGSHDLQMQLEDRVQTLYVDLTNYQVAWKIAQRIQQDITQLLRG